jgi:hypothetical protein
MNLSPGGVASHQSGCAESSADSCGVTDWRDAEIPLGADGPLR